MHREEGKKGSTDSGRPRIMGCWEILGQVRGGRTGGHDWWDKGRGKGREIWWIDNTSLTSYDFKTPPIWRLTCLFTLHCLSTPSPILSLSETIPAVERWRMTLYIHTRTMHTTVIQQNRYITIQDDVHHSTTLFQLGKIIYSTRAEAIHHHHHHHHSSTSEAPQKIHSLWTLQD